MANPRPRYTLKDTLCTVSSTITSLKVTHEATGVCQSLINRLIAKGKSGVLRGQLKRVGLPRLHFHEQNLKTIKLKYYPHYQCI